MLYVGDVLTSAITYQPDVPLIYKPLFAVTNPKSPALTFELGKSDRLVYVVTPLIASEPSVAILSAATAAPILVAKSLLRDSVIQLNPMK